MEDHIERLHRAINRKKIWHEEPVFCFTSDIDWASESVLSLFFQRLEDRPIKLTCFVTHDSDIINEAQRVGKIQRGIHPNFLPASSHGDTFEEVIDHCMEYAPEAKAYRSHRYFEVSDTAHMLKNKYGFEYGSNTCTNMQQGIQPFLHESGLIQMPVFLEDGTHMYNGMDLNIKRYSGYLESPGLKIISFHPMNFVFNSPNIPYMRNIKDSMSREAYQAINEGLINQLSNTGPGIGNTIFQLMDWVENKGKTVLSLEQIYGLAIEE